MTNEDRAALDALDRRIKIILPEQYEDYEQVQPVSMGSAGLKFGDDGKVQWNEMWATFCDLAMAGGPPHKGKLLEPGDAAAIQAEPDPYLIVVAEICRGIRLVTDLPAHSSPIPGWVRIECLDEVMAEWLLRAIVMENVSVRCDGRTIDLPAAPHFRLEKEIKNVITVAAKTCHYWMDHTWDAHQALIGELFSQIGAGSPLIEPVVSEDDRDSGRRDRIVTKMSESIGRALGLPVVHDRYAAWLGVDLASVKAAIWMMRAMVVENVLARREDTILFLPLNPYSDPDGRRVVETLLRVRHLAAASGAL